MANGEHKPDIMWLKSISVIGIKRSEILENIGETLSNPKSYRNDGHRGPTDLIRNSLLCLFIQKSVNYLFVS